MFFRFSFARGTKSLFLPLLIRLNGCGSTVLIVKEEMKNHSIKAPDQLAARLPDEIYRSVRPDGIIAAVTVGDYRKLPSLPVGKIKNLLTMVACLVFFRQLAERIRGMRP